jgi:predicted Zn-dependent peptidase
MFEPKQINQKFKSGEYVVNTQNSQSYLIVFWSIGEILSAKESIVLQIVNSIFGSSPNSKLFMNIREKHSLSYHTSSAYIDGINVIMGFAGIQADKFDLAKTVMLEQMNQLSKSVISVEEIKSAKQRYSEIFKSATDSADQLILVNSILKSLGFETKQEAIEYIDSIGIIDIEKMIKKINQQPLIYFEKGEIDE